MSKAEKRKYQRIGSDFKVLISSEENEDMLIKFKEGHASNVSGGGILLSYAKPLKIDELVHVKFLKPNSFDFFEGSAKVVRVESNLETGLYDIGVSFLELSSEDKERLDYYLQLTEEE